MIEHLITLAILLLNFSIVIWIRNKVALVSSIMITNLLIILLCSISISDYQSLKELIIAIIIYSITILILISNTGRIDHINFDDTKKPFLKLANKINYLVIIMIILLLSYGGFYLSSKIEKQSIDNEIGQVKQITQPKNIVSNSENQTDTNHNLQEDKLEKNILFHHSTDAILIIIGVMIILLLGSKYRNQESNI